MTSRQSARRGSRLLQTLLMSTCLTFRATVSGAFFSLSRGIIDRGPVSALRRRQCQLQARRGPDCDQQTPFYLPAPSRCRGRNFLLVPSPASTCAGTPLASAPVNVAGSSSIRARTRNLQKILHAHEQAPKSADQALALALSFTRPESSSFTCVCIEEVYKILRETIGEKMNRETVADPPLSRRLLDAPRRSPRNWASRFAPRPADRSPGARHPRLARRA